MNKQDFLNTFNRAIEEDMGVKIDIKSGHRIRLKIILTNLPQERDIFDETHNSNMVLKSDQSISVTRIILVNRG